MAKFTMNAAASRLILCWGILFAALLMVVTATCETRMHKIMLEPGNTPRITVGIASSALGVHCGMHARGKIAAGVASFRVAMEIEDRCVVASTSYQNGKTC